MLNRRIKQLGKWILKRCPKSLELFIKRGYYLRLLRDYSEAEEPDIKVITFLAVQGECALDIGANIGVYTKYLSRYVGNNGCVYSIEPIPITFSILNNNIKALNLCNAKALNYAVSDANGSTTMEIPDSEELAGENFYEARIVKDNKSDNRFRRFVVQTRTIDDLFLELPQRICFIKCDVEGNEIKVIKGAVKTISKYKPAWHIEIAGDPDDPRSAAYQTFAIMKDHGYEPFCFDGKKLRSRVCGETNINYFFLTKEHLTRLEKTGFLL